MKQHMQWLKLFTKASSDLNSIGKFCFKSLNDIFMLHNFSSLRSNPSPSSKLFNCHLSCCLLLLEYRGYAVGVASRLNRYLCCHGNANFIWQSSNLKYESYQLYGWFLKNHQTLGLKYWVLWWVATSFAVSPTKPRPSHQEWRIWRASVAVF